MKFIHGSDIQRGLREISPSHIAVAYVGIDWKTYVAPENLKDIVLSPTVGTNPAAIVEIAEVVGWEQVHFLDNLHAKIYLGERGAAVGSFNLTANGLSAEGLQEAGFIVDDAPALAELRARLDDYRQQADMAYPTTEAKLACLAELRAKWDRAIKQGVIRNDAKATTLEAYRPVSIDEIYVCWVSGQITYTDQIVSHGTVNSTVSFLESDAVQPDRWILCWVPRVDGHPDERCRPYWQHIDEVIEGGAHEAPYTKAAVERIGRAELPPPFELNDAAVHALYAVLNSGEFPEFLYDQETWSVDRTLPRLPAFLQALSKFAREAADAATHTHAAGEKPGTTSISLDALAREFGARIRKAMDISIREKYVKAGVIEGLMATYEPVTLAKRLVKPGHGIKGGLRSLAKHSALRLSFESIMLEPHFESLFNKRDLECARFNLFEVDQSYQPPSA
ncbi:phospholipase D family protein [Burkholderia cenocepacia]|uniref:phospholipase D family protein n=1 Tax=Burkholderia cenocepacia TaxID=95486 RepID=UPI001BA0A8F7|nr:phospholipase D family protein [Burkholderia cenocepacia]MBR8070062.1 phospholipase D family protein [Burkholderia cenocepacia]MBR8443798.1 phospholipase D family protein [Burkholderia cenocepacia]